MLNIPRIDDRSIDSLYRAWPTSLHGPRKGQLGPCDTEGVVTRADFSRQRPAFSALTGSLIPFEYLS